MSLFTYKGRKYINGYACDAHGRPITIKNGYSSEDERDGHQDYLEALELSKKEKQVVPKKYSTKTKIEAEMSQELMDTYLQEYYTTNRKSQDGYLLNDAGEKISVENGYTDADERFTKRQVKSMSL